MPLVLAIVLGVSAYAADPVLVYQPTEGAIEEVAQWSEKPVDSLYAVSMTDLLASRKPEIVGGRSFHCAGAPESHLKLRQTLDNAEKAVSYVKTQIARANLDAATDTLRCLMEPVNTKLVSRIFFMRGVVSLQEDDQASALNEFRQALLYDVGLEWDSAFPPEYRASFDLATEGIQGERTSRMQIIPHPGEQSLWVDGQQIPATRTDIGLSAGRHLVQIGSSIVESIEVEIGMNETISLVVPAAVPDTVLSWVLDPERQADLAIVLGILMPGQGGTYVVTDGQVWWGVPGQSAWLRTDRDTDFADSLPKYSLISGGTLALTGASLAVYTLINDKRLVEMGLKAEDEMDEEGWGQAQEALDRSFSTRMLGISIAVAGTGLGTWGYLNRDSNLTSAPILLPGGFGLMMNVRR